MCSKMRRWPQRSGAIGRRAQQNHIAKTRTLLLQAIQETARPDELSGQYAEREKNSHPARSGSDHHDDSERKQRKPREDFQPAFRLLHGLY